MAKYQKYAECKDSGVEWLGEIPSHWEMWKLSHAYNEIGSGTTPSTSNEENFEGDIPWVTTGELRENIILDTKKKVSQKTIELFPTLRKYPSGSVAIAMYGATIGRLGILGVEATTNQACCVMTTSKVLDNKYLFYWLQAFKNEIIQLSSGGGQPNINQEKVASLKISAPLVEDQVTIVNFLDHETAKIDSLISKQEKLIELLKEKRQAVISHAVTKGLNSNVPMKDSGVEWLGQVPEHWDTTKIKYVAELTPKKSEVSSNDNRLCTFVPMEKLKLGSLIKDEEKPISEVIGGYTYFKNGDLLLAKVTPCFENKNMVVASDLKNGIGFGSSEIYVLRTNHKVNTQFLYYRLQEDQFMELGTGAMTGAGGLKRVPSEFLNNFEFALPPLSEQIAITKYLNQYLIKNEYLMNKAQSAIQLMQERRTALISAAVTGKIDVRNWQNPNKNNEAKTELSA